MRWTDALTLQQSLEQRFQQILELQMQGIAVLNPALTVQAYGFKAIQNDWLGIMITPWFMNLMLLPNSTGLWTNARPGESLSRNYPYGQFDFTLGHDSALGHYGQCSLFSPMLEFADQYAAIIAAEAILKALLAEPRNLSRRDLLRGRFS